MSKVIFKDFSDFWFHTKKLSNSQRDTIFFCLSQQEQKRLHDGYVNGGWDDLIFRNHIDQCVDDMVKNFGINMIRVRNDVVFNKKKFKIKRKYWKYFTDMLHGIDDKHKIHVLNGIKTSQINDEYIVLKKK